MKKLTVFVLVAGVTCFVAAVFFCRLLSRRIAEAESHLPGINVAIARLTDEQNRVSMRLQKISSQPVGVEKTTLDEVVAIVNDAELNRIARTYTGSDWSSVGGPLLERVSREKARTGEIERKTKELENRKHGFRHRLKGRREGPAERASRHEIIELERQVESLQSQASADNAALARQVTQYKAATIGELHRAMAEKLESLNREKAIPSRLRQMASVFDFWPLNVICNVPSESRDEK